MTPSTPPPLRDLTSRRFAAGGPPVTWWVFQPAGGAVAFGAARAGASPTGLTGAGLLLGLAGCGLLATSDSPAGFGGAGVLLLLAYVLDCADGQLARATGRTSERGAWLDVAADAAVVVALAVAVAHSGATGDNPVLSLAAATLLGAGRAASLLAGTLARREPGRERWTSTGLQRVARTAYVSLVDTPVVYAALAAAGAAGLPLAVAAAPLGAVAAGHALVVGRRTWPGAATGSRPA